MPVALDGVRRPFPLLFRADGARWHRYLTVMRLGLTGDGVVQRRDGSAGLGAAGGGVGVVGRRGASRRRRAPHLRPLELHAGLSRGEHRTHPQRGGPYNSIIIHI